MKSSALVLTGIAILMCVVLVFTKLNGRKKRGRDTSSYIQQQEHCQHEPAEELDVYPYSILVNMPY